MILFQFFPILFFFILNSLTVKISKKPFGISMPVTLMISAMGLYFSQMIFGSFKPAYILLLLAGLGAVIVFIRNIRLAEYRNCYFSAGFICVFGIAAFVAFIDLGKHYFMWDEFSHWGKMVKEMIRLDAFYSAPESTLLVHKDYPPFIGLFEVLWCRLAGGYSEGSVNRALHFLELCLVAPYLCEKIVADSKLFRKLIAAAAMIACCVLIMLSFDGEAIFRTIYPDFLVPALFGYAFFAVLDKDINNSIFGVFSIILSLSAMALTKQVSIAFILLVWFFYTINLANKKNCSFKCGIVTSILVLAVPFIIMKSWNLYTKGLGLTGQFDLSKISVSSIFGILCGHGEEVQLKTRDLYFEALIKQPLSSGTVKLSYLTIALFITVLLTFLYVIYKKQFNKSVYVKLLITIVGGSVAYAFMMFVLYMFCFSEYEMLNLNSYGRYMDCYVVGVLFVILFVIAELVGKEVHYASIVPLLILAVLILDFGRIYELLPKRLTGIVNMENNPYATLGEFINFKTEPNDKLLLISPDNCKKTYYVNYYLDDGRVIDERYLYTDVATISADNLTFWNEYTEYAHEFDYICIYETSSEVNAALNEYISSGVIEDRSLFKVTDDNGKLSLVRVN